MKISEHFTLAEATKSQTALRNDIDNTPDEGQISNIIAVAENILEPVREYYGVPFSPSSFFRCLDLNRKIGSKDTSQHPKGEAVDFEVPGVVNISLATWCRDNLQFDQLILEFYDHSEPTSGWIHMSYVDPSWNRSEALTIGRAGIIHGLPGD